MSDEPKQDQEQIEAARLRLQRVAALAVNAEEAKSAFDDIDALCDAARPEHPDDRQAALERLLTASRKLRTTYDFEEEAVSGSDATIAMNSEFLEALDALEGK
jgi:hypothetical protein